MSKRPYFDFSTFIRSLLSLAFLTMINYLLSLGCLLSFIMLSSLLPPCAASIFLFVFTEANVLAQPKTRHLLVNLVSIQRLVSIHLILQKGKILNRFIGFTSKLYQHEMRTIYLFVEKLSQCYKYCLSLVHTNIRIT